MFSSVGWGEILVLVVVGIIVVGPERLPRLITDVKALLLAARTTIANARKELDQDFGEDFEEFRKPLSQLNSVRQMGARGFITKTLLDDDDSFLTDLQSTANDVTGAVRGTAGQISGGTAATQPANPPRPTEVPAQPDQALKRPEQQQDRVEVPQQDEVGQSRDWSSPANYDDTM